MSNQLTERQIEDRVRKHLRSALTAWIKEEASDEEWTISPSDLLDSLFFELDGSTFWSEWDEDRPTSKAGVTKVLDRIDLLNMAIAIDDVAGAEGGDA